MRRRLESAVLAGLVGVCLGVIVVLMTLGMAYLGEHF